MTKEPRKSDSAIAQTQFLTILSREEAMSRWLAALAPAPIGTETVPLSDARGRICASRVVSPIDNPPFDRSGVDGFAVRSQDLDSKAQTRLVIVDRVAAGHAEGSLPASQAQLEILTDLVRRWTPEHLHGNRLDVTLQEIRRRTRQFFTRLFGRQ